MTDNPSAIPEDELESRLRQHVGDTVFERGTHCFEQGQVGTLSISGSRTRATVTGTSQYRVEVRRTPRGFDGHCSCPASDGFDFCKHCVAVTLAVETHHAKRERAAAGKPIDRVRLYLETLPREELVSLVADSASQFPDLQSRLQLRSDAATGALDIRALKKLVTAGLPLRNVWQRTKVRAYFAKGVTAINNLLDVADLVSPDNLLAVSTYAIERLNSVLERVDDSDGNRWFVQDRVRTLYAVALRRIDGTADERSALLLTQVLRDPYDMFDDTIDDFQKALGDEGIEAFYRQAHARMDAEMAESDVKTAATAILARLLIHRAEETGDIDTLITLSKQQSTGAFDQYRLAELYLRKPDLDAALAALDQGDAIANEYNRDDALRVSVHAARAEWRQAVDAQMNVLSKQPSSHAYDALLELADKTESRAATQRQARRALSKQLDAGHPGRSDAATVLALLAHEQGKLDTAFEYIVSHVSDPAQLLDMMRWYEQDQPARAAQLFDCVIEATISHKKSGAYRDAIKLIKKHRPLFESLGPRMFDAFIVDLRERHRAKRNLMALLDTFI